MKIRVEKCITFGIKKSTTSSVQFLPKLIINNSLVPTVVRNNSYKYLGRFFNFSMDNTDHMSALLSTINDLMMKVDCLPCHPKNKLLLYHRFVLSKLSLHLTIADLSKTWVIENLDSIVTGYVRKWLELPISATISSLILNKSRYCINLVLPYTKFIKCQTVIRNSLKSTPNFDIKVVWAETSYGTNLQYDQFQNTKQVLKSIQQDHEERINNTLLSQGLVIPQSLNNQVRILGVFGQLFSKTCQGTFLIFLSSILIMLSPLVRTSVGGLFPNRLIATFVSNQKHYSMLYLAASRIWMRAGTLGDITLFSFFLLTHSRH